VAAANNPYTTLPTNIVTSPVSSSQSLNRRATSPGSVKASSKDRPAAREPVSSGGQANGGGSAANSGGRAGNTSQVGELTAREKKVLKTTSVLNGKVYLPWVLINCSYNKI
jgi:hypothetical protein